VARAEEGQRGKARAVAGLEATCESCQSRRWRRQGCSGGERRRPAMARWFSRATERRGVLREGQQRGAKAVDELGGDAWSGAGAGGSLGRRCCAAEGEQRKKKEGGGALGAELLTSKTPGTSL
jgi:hypothetical protein